MPSYNSVFRYLEAEALTPYLYELIAASALPLKSVEEDFAIDSSGFSTGQFMRWFDVKYGKEEDRRMWLKVHLMCGVKTNIVTSVEISDGYANGLEVQIEIEIIIYDHLTVNIHKARVDNYLSKRRQTLTPFILRDNVVRLFDAELLCHFPLRQSERLTDL
jgi:hypothetical protein